jgi:integrase
MNLTTRAIIQPPGWAPQRRSTESKWNVTACDEMVRSSWQASTTLAAMFVWEELLGHTDVRTTMIYTHVLNRGVFV